MARPPMPPGPYLIVGLARSGVAAALALADAVSGSRIVACDTGRPEEALASYGRLEQAGVEVHFETEGLELLEGEVVPRTLVKSPGVPKEASVVSASKKTGVQVIGELELAWRMLDNRFCAVTGTNGKTTACEMIGEMFKVAGEPVEVVGNIGVPASSLVGRVNSRATVVCEVSSFQLEDTEKFAPEVAVFLNISEDHLDRHITGASYLHEKLRIFENQVDENIAVLNAGEPALRETSLPGSGKEVWFGLQGPCASHGGCSAYVDGGYVCWRGEKLFPVGEFGLRGQHNLENALASIAVGMSLGLNAGSVAAAAIGFQGVEHRLEVIAEVGGVLYVNDSKATNVKSTLAALGAFDTGVHLILGGYAKGGGFDGLRGPVSRRSRACYLIGDAAGKMEEDLAGCGVPLIACGDLETAVDAASSSAAMGDVVLLAPACASFDQFESFEARGERFRELVAELRGSE